MESRLTLDEFFLLVEAGEMDRLATQDYIEKATKYYQPDRLRILLDELNIHIGIRRDEIENSLLDKIKERITEYKQQGKELPIKEIKFPARFQIEVTKVLDKDKLLGGEISWRMYPLYELRKDVKLKLEQSFKDVSNSPRPTEASPVSNSIVNLTHEPGIEQFLNEDGLKYLPILKNLYKNPKHKGDYVKMLFALHELKLLNINPRDIGDTSYHNALVATFGKASAASRATIEYNTRNSETHLHQSKTKKELQRIKQAIDASSSLENK